MMGFQEYCNYFHLLPIDVLAYLVHFLDIPSIGALSQTSKADNGSIAYLASSEATWLNLVNKRFNLGKSSHCRPKLYGGPTWKTAYRCMASCNKLPKMRNSFKKKAIFAKGAGFASSSTIWDENTDERRDTKLPAEMSAEDQDQLDDLEGEEFINFLMTSKKRIYYNGNNSNKKVGRDKFISTWVMINHTEDCTLRTTNLEVNQSIHYDNMSGSRSINTAPTPYIELQVAYQSTKSGFCSINVDISKTTVHMMCGSSILSQRIIREGPLKPRVLYKSIGDHILFHEGGRIRSNRKSCSNLLGFLRDGKAIQSADMKRCNSYHSLCSVNSFPIVLKPFEFVIVSMNVPLTHYVNNQENIRFETDFLSRAISICTPVSLHRNSTKCNKESIAGDDMRHYSVSSISVASFLAEHSIWDHYMELPGNCLTLSNRNTYNSA